MRKQSMLFRRFEQRKREAVLTKAAFFDESLGKMSVCSKHTARQGDRKQLGS